MRRVAGAALLLLLPSSPHHAVAQGAAKVKFLSPTEGATVAGPQVEVLLAFDGFKTVPAGTPVRRGAEGHAHLFIDVDPVGSNQLVPTDLPTVVHLGAQPFDARAIKLADGTHTLHALLADSAHRTFHRPAMSKVTFTVAPGFRGKGELTNPCADFARGTGEVRLVFPLGGGVLQGTITSTCSFTTEAGACRWEAISFRRLLGSYDAAEKSLTGSLTGTTRRTLRSGERRGCGPTERSALPPDTFTATHAGGSVTGDIGRSGFELRPDPSVVLAAPRSAAAAAAPPAPAAGGFPWPWLLLAGALGTLGAIGVRSRRRRAPVATAETTACDRCGAELRPRSRFCSNCGTALMEGRDTGSGRVITAAPSPSHVFRREGEFWTVSFGEHTIRMKDSKGMRHLAHLLANPAREYHVLDLVGAEEGHAPEAGDRAEDLAVRAEEGVEVLDSEAKAAYRRRLADLEDELAEAQSWGDPERAARAQEEKEALMAELAAGVGLGGRDRKTSSPVERARWSVTRAIRSSVQKIAESHTSLGEHLSSTVRTGTFCSYTPDSRTPITWTL